MHPRDAKKRGISEGDNVEISTRRGTIQAAAHVSRQVRPGCIWMALHFAEARANVLTNDAGDPVTGTAEFKVCAAEVRRSDDQSKDPIEFRGSYFTEGVEG